MCVIYTEVWVNKQNVCYIYKIVGQNTNVCVIKQDCVSKYKIVLYIYNIFGQNTRLCVIYTMMLVKIQECNIYIQYYWSKYKSLCNIYNIASPNRRVCAICTSLLVNMLFNVRVWVKYNFVVVVVVVGVGGVFSVWFVVGIVVVDAGSDGEECCSGCGIVCGGIVILHYFPLLLLRV